MVSAAEHLRGLRRQLEVSLDARARQIVEPSLASLEQLIGDQADPSAGAEELLDLLEDLLEALVHERGWTLPGGGPR